MNVFYPAIFYKEDDGGYSVVFPDLNFLSTCGDDMQEALKMAIDCLAGYVYSCKKDKEDIPAPSNREEIDIAAFSQELGVDARNAFVNIIAVDVDAYAKTHFEKSVKKTLSIPAWLNNMAMEQNINFSKVLQEALKERLGVANM